jgi:Tol biopolymer transport system component
LCEAPNSAGGTWNQKGIILFSPDCCGPIHRISDAGGAPTAVTSLDVSRQETGHVFPSFLPDGNHFLYLVQSEKAENRGIWVGSLDGKVSRQILATFSSVRFAPPGYLLFVRDRTLMAQPFDAEALQLTGDALPIAERVQQYLYRAGIAAFSVSDTGVLVFRSGTGYVTQLTWLDRSGKLQEPFGRPGAYVDPELSPDGNFVAVELEDESGGRDIWLMDVLRGTSSRFTFDAGAEVYPLWAPDGSWLAFSSLRFGLVRHYRRRISGTGDEELPLGPGSSKELVDRSSDGRFLLYNDHDASTGSGLWTLPLFGDRKPQPFLQTRFITRHARFSPEARWVAYVSGESGRLEVYVESFPIPSGKKQISIDGGTQPRWRRDGRELFFLAADGKLMAVPIKGDAALEIGAPAALFEAHIGAPFGDASTFLERQQYDVTPNGERFLINRASSEALPITVVLNWTAGLKP